MEGRIRAEWEPLRKLVMHRPGIEMFLGLLDPYASLYERAFDQQEAQEEHDQLAYILKNEFKVEVLCLKEKILETAEKDENAMKRLVKMACNSINFIGEKKEAESARNQLEANSKIMGPEYFFNIILLHPVVSLKVERGQRAINLNTTERTPLANLYFLRDQQAVTDKGIFMSRMSKPQRAREPIITEFLWKTLDLEIVHETSPPGTFEGGDFMPLKDFALAGLGDRTNASGISQLLSRGIGFDEVGVVHQPRHPLIPLGKKDAMIGMHLDAYFNIASSCVAVGCDPLLKAARVEVFCKEGRGNYRKKEAETTLYEYIKKKGFEIIDITVLEQMAYASNFLCIKDGTILAVEVDRIVKTVIDNLSSQSSMDPERYGALLEQVRKDYRNLKDSSQFFPHKKEVYQSRIDAFPINLKNLTGGYGGAHCMTCPIVRG